MTGAAASDHDLGRALRREWFSHLRDLADMDLQRHTWLDPSNTNPHRSYIEFLCSYPENDQLTFALDNDWLSGAEFRLLSDFGRLLTAHEPPNGDDWGNAAVLDDPAWQAVVSAAQTAIDGLLRLLNDPAERIILTIRTR